MTPSAPQRLDASYLLLTGRAVEQLVGGDHFWTRLQSDASLAARVSTSWLVGEYPTEETWDHWEMHPNGDEVVHLAAGTIDVHLESGAVQSVRLECGDTIVIPARTWHTVTVHQPARLLNITWGDDTRTRPRTAELAGVSDESSRNGP